MKTVNFIEAVNSGRRFKLVDACTWYRVNNGKVQCFNFEGTESVDSRSCIQSTFINSRFELEEKEISLKELKLEKAWKKVWRTTAYPYELTELKKELGF